MNSMHALLLDFQDTRHRISWLSWLLLFSGVAVATYLVIQIVNLRDTLDNLETKRTFIAGQIHQTAQTKLSPADRQKLQAEIKDAEAVMSQLTLPWESLLKDIGASQQQQVALLSIVPNAAKRTIKISGEARDFDDVLAYIRALQKANSLRTVYLQNHHIETRSAQRPVRFSLLATWVVNP